MTKANIKSLIILYDSTQRSKEIMLNFQEKLIERDSVIYQLYAYSITTSKSSNSSILEKIGTNKFTKSKFLISRNKALISLIFRVLRNIRVMNTVILHGPTGSNYTLKEDKLDLIFLKRDSETVHEKVSQALVNSIKKLQFVLNFTNATNIT